MDLLLTHGYYLYSDPHELQVMRPYPPLGILYLSSHLKARGYAVDVFDTTFSDEAAFVAHLAHTRPAVVGIYVNMLTRPTVLRAIQHCKAIGAHVVLGGPEPVNYVEQYLAHGADVVVIGEGELTLEELLPVLARSGPQQLAAVHGIAYRDDNGLVQRTPPRKQIANLSAQPFPDRAAIDIPRYMQVWREHHGMSAVSLITARGCPYTCTWCSHAVYGHTHRRRSAANVADEVAQIVADYGPDLLWYADDVFTIHKRWLFEYAAELKQRGLTIPFETISREDRLDEEVVKTLAEMACYRLWVGAESGSQRVLDAMQRRTDAVRMREMITLLQRHGIEAGTFIMLGYDGEETRDIAATVHHLSTALPDKLLTTVAYPIKGTPYYEQVADRIVPLKAWAEGSDRDATVAGRHSRRFYQHATRWMVNEVAWRRQQQQAPTSYPRIARHYLSAKLGRVGMWLTEGERERGV
ncbi:radical SAM protein [Candidatus Gracilibacteria bacterium]|nr:radical SAM protein [Candidatus Gracilibacteria bacterium]